MRQCIFSAAWFWLTNFKVARYRLQALDKLTLWTKLCSGCGSIPMVVEAMEEKLRCSGVDPLFVEYLDQFNQIAANFGITSAAKGVALEPFVQHSLQRFNGFLLADLPFLKAAKLSKWCYILKFQIDKINTANVFEYGAEGIKADLDFFADSPSNKMLIAHSVTRTDDTWFFSDNHYVGSLAIELYSNQLSQSIHGENETSSDIRCSFLKKDGTSPNPLLEKIRDNFEASGAPAEIEGILRIHLEFRRVLGLKTSAKVFK